MIAFLCFKMNSKFMSKEGWTTIHTVMIIIPYEITTIVGLEQMEKTIINLDYLKIRY